MGRSFCRCLNAPCGRSLPKRDTLRLRFSEQAGEPAQIVGEPTAWSLPIIDVSGEPDARARPKHG